MNANDFVELWKSDEEPEELVQVSKEAIAEVHIPEDAKIFLESAGLPSSAAPFLTFDALAQNPLQNAATDYDRLQAEYARYWIIGGNSCGDPICVDEKEQGRVVYLNHDNNFDVIFMNSSVPQLAECLLEYRTLLEETQKMNGPEAWLDRQIPSDIIKRLEDQILKIDHSAINSDSFWDDEIRSLNE